MAMFHRPRDRRMPLRKGGPRVHTRRRGRPFPDGGSVRRAPAPPCTSDKANTLSMTGWSRRSASNGRSARVALFTQSPYSSIVRVRKVVPRRRIALRARRSRSSWPSLNPRRPTLTIRPPAAGFKVGPQIRATEMVHDNVRASLRCLSCHGPDQLTLVAAVDHDVGAERREEVSSGPIAGRPQHEPRSKQARDLHRDHPDRRPSALNQDGVACDQTSAGRNSVVSRHQGDRRGGRLEPAQ